MDKDTVYIPNTVNDNELYSEPNHPVVKVVWCHDHYEAIEGSHRGLAAEKFDYPLNIELCEPDEVIKDHDIDASELWGKVTAQGIIDYLYDGPLTCAFVEVVE